jgi:YggT family protein
LRGCSAAAIVRLHEDRHPVTGASFLSYWYFHLPNFILAAIMYTLFGRVLLGLFVDPDSPNYIWRFFCRITDPFVAVFALVTPKATPPVILWLFGFVWMFWLRVLMLNMYLWLGIAPKIG